MASKTDPAGNTSTVAYDGYGNKTSETDAAGRVTTYTFDPNGHMLTQVLTNFTGDPVTFKVRTFRADVGNETWDFGDGSPPAKVHSDGNAKPHDPNGYAVTIHRFVKAGHYIVRVEGIGHGGMKATAHLQVRVGQKSGLE